LYGKGQTASTDNTAIHSYPYSRVRSPSHRASPPVRLNTEPKTPIRVNFEKGLNKPFSNFPGLMTTGLLGCGNKVLPQESGILEGISGLGADFDPNEKGA